MPGPQEWDRGGFQRWLKTRPPVVQAFAKLHPDLIPGAKIVLPVIGDHWLIGFLEQEDQRIGLLVTPINPAVDYDGAVEARMRICADHFEQP
jgi:hypothetical protein